MPVVFGLLCGSSSSEALKEPGISSTKQGQLPRLHKAGPTISARPSVMPLHSLQRSRDLSGARRLRPLSMTGSPGGKGDNNNGGGEIGQEMMNLLMRRMSEMREQEERQKRCPSLVLALLLRLQPFAGHCTHSLPHEYRRSMKTSVGIHCA
jgi:hypothetical protein